METFFANLLTRALGGNGAVKAVLQPFESYVAKHFILPNLTRKLHPPPLLSGMPLLIPRAAQKRIRYTLDTARPGISLVVSPRECGKTTTLISEFNAYLQERKGHGAFFPPNSFQSSNDPRKAFYERFGGEQRCHDLCDILRPKSTIVFDQVEQIYAEPMISVLRSLMTESMRSENVSVVVAVSSVEKARILLDLNGGEKVRVIVPPSDFKWGAESVDTLIAAYDQQEKRQPSDLLGSVKGLRELALESGTAGFLPQFEQRLRIDGKDKAMEWGHDRAHTDVGLWKSFEEFERMW